VTLVGEEVAVAELRERASTWDSHTILRYSVSQGARRRNIGGLGPAGWCYGVKRATEVWVLS
jgi:hypothetical protein